MFRVLKNTPAPSVEARMLAGAAAAREDWETSESIITSENLY